MNIGYRSEECFAAELPQWQGSDRPGYRVGGRVLAAIAPDPQGPVETVPVPASTGDNRPVEDGIASRHVLLEQIAAARAAIERHAPEAIVTLGGDCHVSFAPFAYLNERYGDDLAVLWVDAHPDIMGPEQMANAHAHVLAMLMGEAASDFTDAVPRKVDPKNILYVGLTETTPFETGFVEKHGIARLSPEELAGSRQGPRMGSFQRRQEDRRSFRRRCSRSGALRLSALHRPVAGPRRVRRRRQGAHVVRRRRGYPHRGERRSRHRRPHHRGVYALERNRIVEVASHAPAAGLIHA